LASPYWNPHIKGTIVGLTGGVKKEHLIRATLESIAFQVADIIRLMEEETGIPVNQLKVDGGMVVNDFLMQFQADILDVPIVVPQVTETTCLGAAYLAGLHVGFWESLEELSANWKKNRIYDPQMDRSRAEELLDGWRKAIQNVINVYR
jgi:glycerol kinase